MPPMPQDGRVIVAIFVAFSLFSKCFASGLDTAKCKYCEQFIQNLLYKNNFLRILQDKPWLSDQHLENLSEGISEFDFIKFCMGACIKSEYNGENNAIRRKRDTEQGIYKYFSPPFSDPVAEQPGYEVFEAPEEPHIHGDTAKSFPEYDQVPNFDWENSRRNMHRDVPEPGKETTPCECLVESVKKVLEMTEEFAGRVIESLRGMIREEVRSRPRPREVAAAWLIALQQNNFVVPFPVPNPPAARYVESPVPKTQIPETTTTREIQSAPTTVQLETTASSSPIPDLTTDIPDETTTEVPDDLPEPAMRSEDGVPPDCGKAQDSPIYLPALLEAFKPKHA